jgi:hypothetical protein
MITPETALTVAQAYVSEHRPHCEVEGLDEDDRDYAVRLRRSDPKMVWPTGYAIILISKETGLPWESAPGKVFDRLLAMTPVAS